MRHILALISLLFCTFAAQAERVDYLSTSFDGGLPAGTLTLDRDAQELHFTMVQAGFDQGDSWRVFTLEGNSYAASPARHKVGKGETALAADDWMVLPSVSILAADATLSWNATTMAESIEEGCSYEVRISTRGGQPEDFTDAPVFSIDEESIGKWAEHSVSLAAYAGKEVWIAFVHTSLNREILAVDNLCVSGSPGLYRLDDVTQRYQDTETTTIEARFTATSSTPIAAFTAFCEFEGTTLSERFPAANLSATDDALPITFTVPRRLSPGEDLPYSLRVEVEDNSSVEQPAVEGSVMRLSFLPERRIVVEEGTGMWCGYCPRGIVAMRQMREKYPDSFIGIAVHYDDVLGTAVADYCNSLHFPSFPSAYVNRTTLCGDPMPQEADGQFSVASGLERYFLEAMKVCPPAELALAWTIRDNGQLALLADAHFAINAEGADYRFAAVAVEDEVTNSTYYQTNYYSGSAVPLGGFETEDKTIRPYTFEEVARAALLPFEGAEGDIPSRIVADRHYSAVKQLKAPVFSNLRNARIVLMLLDAHTGEVVNAVQAPAVSSAEFDAVLSGIASTPSLPQPSAAGATYTLDGRRASQEFRGLRIENGRLILR